MPLFAKKPVESAPDNLTELESNIGTMSDDVAKAISAKNRGGRRGWRRASGRAKEIQRDLADVYTNDDGQIPDLTRLERSERPLWQTILYSLIAVFAVLFVLALAGFFIFTNLGSESFTNEKVTFKIEPPISIVSGQEQTYTIILSNKERVNLYNLNIELLYPEGFVYVSGTPEASGDKKNIWDLSVLKVGETKELTFRGKLLANLNSVNNLSGKLTFKPENLNADFNQKASIDLGVNSSIVTAMLEGPDKVLANDRAEYVLNLKNIGEEMLKNLEVVFSYPQSFVFASSSPDAKSGSNNIFSVSRLATTSPTLASTTDYKIIIDGDYSSIADSGNQEMGVKVNLKQDNGDLLLAEQSLTTSVIKDQLSLTLVVNGSGEDQAVGFGDLLFYTLSYKNTGQDELKDLTISVHLDSEVLDWSTLLDDNKGKIKDNAIIWTGKEVPKLLSLRPGEEGEISWQIRVKDLAAVNKQDIAKFSIENWAEAQVKNKDGGLSTVKSKVLVNSINSDLSLKAAARYYNDDNVALGAGPITPQAGQGSSYNIQLTLSNNLHNIGNIEVSAVLPKNVSWDNKEIHNTGNVSYSANSRKVSWTISKLLKTAVGTEADFNLSITPTEGDVGRVLILLPEIKLTAKDLDTGAAITKSVKAITTSFNDPILGQLSGIVE